jgi:hypothetical protein
MVKEKKVESQRVYQLKIILWVVGGCILIGIVTADTITARTILAMILVFGAWSLSADWISKEDYKEFVVGYTRGKDGN